MIQKSVVCWPNRQCTDVRFHRPGRGRECWDYSLIERLVESQARMEMPKPISLAETLEHAASICPSVTISPRRLEGLPCMTGTRIPVHLVIWAVEHHGSIDGALEAYPDLSAQQVKDALYFAELVMGSKSGLDKTAPVA
jgi:uncharacterized protein (DUF433 family)